MSEVKEDDAWLGGDTFIALRFRLLPVVVAASPVPRSVISEEELLRNAVRTETV